RTDRAGSTLPHINEPLAAGHRVLRSFLAYPSLEQAGIALPYFGKCEAVEFPYVHFNKPGFDLDFQALSGGNRTSGFQRAGEGARINGDDRLGAQRGCQALRLPAAGLVQRHVRATKRQTLTVGVRLAMADEEEERGQDSSAWAARR